MFLGVRLAFSWVERWVFVHVVWVSRIGVGLMVRMIVRARSSFLLGKFCVACWRSFERLWQSSVLPYSYILVVGVFVFWCLGL